MSEDEALALAILTIEEPRDATKNNEDSVE
jgi:hypothetical protein